MSQNILRFGSSFLLLVLAFGLTADRFYALPQDGAASAADKPPEPEWVESTPESRAAAALAEKRIVRDMQLISIGTASRFHDRVVDKCLPGLPKNLRLSNCGPIGAHDRPRTFRIVGDDAFQCLAWDVDDGSVVVFRFSISTERTKDTVTDVHVDDLHLFVNVGFVDEGKSINEALTALGNRSVRQVLSRLNEQED